jgi:hypothetical protein
MYLSYIIDAINMHQLEMTPTTWFLAHSSNWLS